MQSLELLAVFLNPLEENKIQYFRILSRGWLRSARLLSLVLSSILIATSPLLVGCTSPDRTRKFEENLNAKKCDEALYTVPQREPLLSMRTEVEETGGKVLSYTATGAAYTAQVLWDVTAGAVTFVIACGPLLAVAIVSPPLDSSGAGANFNPCVFNPGSTWDTLSAPKLGEKTFKKTKKWRCPEYTELSRSIRRVTTCYRDRGDVESLKRAQTTIDSLIKSDNLLKCLPKEEVDEVLKLGGEFSEPTAKP